MAIKKSNTVHVISSPKGGWAVKKSGSDRATKVFDTQKDAIKSGRVMVKRGASDGLYVHGRDGRIVETYSVGDKHAKRK